jgi:hypothetical protein
VVIIGPFPQASDDRETDISLPPEYAGGDSMPVTTQILDSSSPSILDAIDQAFEAVWRTLYAHMPPENEQSRELKIALSQTLIGLAADGVTHPHELRRKALESMVLRIQ